MLTRKLIKRIERDYQLRDSISYNDAMELFDQAGKANSLQADLEAANEKITHLESISTDLMVEVTRLADANAKIEQIRALCMASDTSSKSSLGYVLRTVLRILDGDTP